MSNQYNDYYFNKEKSLNHDLFKSSVIISSDLYFDNIGIMTRVKLIFPVQLENDNKTINEDSESITFNYHNQFSENRFFEMIYLTLHPE